MDDGLRPVCGVRELAPAFQSGGKPPRSKMSPRSRFPTPLFTRNACSSHSPLANRLPEELHSPMREGMMGPDVRQKIRQGCPEKVGETRDARRGLRGGGRMRVAAA